MTKLKSYKKAGVPNGWNASWNTRIHASKEKPPWRSVFQENVYKQNLSYGNQGTKNPV